jgi:putative inorganic carbon (hco3(-)) transporter
VSLPQERVAEPSAGFPAAAVAVLVLLSIPLALAAAWRPIDLLVVVVALTVIGASIYRTDVAVFLLLALAPLEGAFAASESAELSPTKAVGLLCVGSFMLNAFATRRRLLLDSSHAIVFALLAFAVVSATQARDATAAISVTLRYASFVALFVIVSQLAAEDHRFQRRVAWVLTAASAVAGLLAIQNFIGGDEYLATLPYSDANETAYFLATTMPLAFWLLAGRASFRPIVFIMIGTIGAAVLLSFSRGALVGLAVGAIWHAFTHRRHVPILVVGVLVGLVVAVGFARSDPRQVETGFELKSQAASENVESRLENWEAAGRLAATHPIGVGPGNFQAYYFEATGRPPSTTGSLVVHNTYLEIAAELGVVAMGLFVAYLVMTFRRLAGAQRQRLGPPDLASALTTSLVVAIVGGLFISEQYNAPFWVIGAFATAIWAERHAGRDRA